MFLFLLMFILFLADYRKFYPLIFADGFHFSQILADFIRGFSRILFLADYRKFYARIFADGFLCFSFYTSTK